MKLNKGGTVKGKNGGSGVVEQDGTMIRFGGFGRDYFGVLCDIGIECDKATGALCKALPDRVEVIDWARGPFSGAIEIDFPFGGWGTCHYSDLRYNGILVTSNILLGSVDTLEPDIAGIIDTLVEWGSMDCEMDAKNMIVELHLHKRMELARHLTGLWNWYVRSGKTSEEIYREWLKGLRAH